MSSFAVAKACEFRRPLARALVRMNGPVADADAGRWLSTEWWLTLINNVTLPYNNCTDRLYNRTACVIRLARRHAHCYSRVILWRQSVNAGPLQEDALTSNRTTDDTDAADNRFNCGNKCQPLDDARIYFECDIYWSGSVSVDIVRFTDGHRSTSRSCMADRRRSVGRIVDYTMLTARHRSEKLPGEGPHSIREIV
jgi:hypothetical protein